MLLEQLQSIPAQHPFATDAEAVTVQLIVAALCVDSTSYHKVALRDAMDRLKDATLFLRDMHFQFPEFHSDRAFHLFWLAIAAASEMRRYRLSELHKRSPSPTCAKVPCSGMASFCSTSENPVGYVNSIWAVYI
jgi:hypothetical protein